MTGQDVVHIGVWEHGKDTHGRCDGGLLGTRSHNDRRTRKQDPKPEDRIPAA